MFLNADSLRSVDSAILSDGLLSDQPYTLVKELSDLGSRFGGTESEVMAVEYLQKKMKEYGFSNVRAEPFSYKGWSRGSASLTTLDSNARDFKVLALPHCGTHSVEADLHYLRYATPGEWEAQKGQLKGKILLVDAKSPHWVPHGIHRREKYGRAVAEGAAGLIWMRDQGGFLIETGGLHPQASDEIPAISISREDGMELLRLAQESQDGRIQVKIATRNTVEERVSWNVVGEIPGNSDTNRHMVIGAHFDGHDIAPGSMDDASGTAVTLEAGRLLAQHGASLARTVKVICFPLEEIGCLGSINYVRAHDEDLDFCDFMLNLDGAGRGGDKGIMLQAWPETIPVFQSISKDMKWPFTVDTSFTMFSDMYPFSYVGVPSGRLADLSGVKTGRDWGHTIADTLDKVSSLNLRLDSVLTARLILRLANWDSWPASRTDTAEILKIIERVGLMDAFEFSSKAF